MLAIPLTAILAAGCTYPCKPIMTAEEAHVLAQKHFERFTSCGGVRETPVDAGLAWAFTAVAGYRPEVDPNPIVVDKQTGEVTWASEEEYRNPSSPEAE